MTDPLYPDAVRLVNETGEVSVSLLRTALDISVVRAVRLIDLLEQNAVVGPAEGAGPRPVLKPMPQRKLFL